MLNTIFSTLELAE